MQDFEVIFKELVSKYSEQLYWHVRGMISSGHEDADDLLQDIYIKVWQALPSFRGESGYFTWLWRIATNEALMYLRKKKVRSALRFQPLDAKAERIIDSDPWFNGSALERELSKAIAALPDKQRSVFIMRYYQDLSYEDISKITGTSVGALKAGYFHATQKIRKTIKDFESN